MYYFLSSLSISIDILRKREYKLYIYVPTIFIPFIRHLGISNKFLTKRNIQIIKLSELVPINLLSVYLFRISSIIYLISSIFQKSFFLQFPVLPIKQISTKTYSIQRTTRWYQSNANCYLKRSNSSAVVLNLWFQIYRKQWKQKT